MRNINNFKIMIRLLINIFNKFKQAIKKIMLKLRLGKNMKISNKIKKEDLKNYLMSKMSLFIKLN